MNGDSSSYEFSSYGIFSDGVNTIKTLNTNIATGVATINDCKSKLNNESVFMGPICDSCVQGFGQVDSKLNTLSSNFTSIANYLVETSSNYSKGDSNASQKILQLNGGVISTTTASNSGAVSGNANQDAIYSYLAKAGFNDAAISGILANIQHESNFNPNALGDGGTSYGICQWHNSRWDRLKSYCSQNNLDSTTLDGQLSYLVWELQNNYPSVYEKIKSVPNTEQGAYDAAYEWTVHYEIPANKESSGQNRGNTAITRYWPTYNTATTV